MPPSANAFLAPSWRHACRCGCLTSLESFIKERLAKADADISERSGGSDMGDWLRPQDDKWG